jgi:hypothetical protein
MLPAAPAKKDADAESLHGLWLAKTSLFLHNVILAWVVKGCTQDGLGGRTER